MEHVAAGDAFHPETYEHLQRIVSLDTASNEDDIVTLLKTVRLLLTKSRSSQQTLVSHLGFSDFINNVVLNPAMRTDRRALHNLTLQVLVNGVVNNDAAQSILWSAHGAEILKQTAAAPLGYSNNLLLMIMYNIYLGGRHLVSDQLALETCVRLWLAIKNAQSDYKFEYLHFFMEHFLVQNARACIPCYQRLTVEERIAFLDYVAHYLREGSPNGKLSICLLQHFAKELKLKSDCILRETIKLRNEMHPREVHTLLRIIASVSGSEEYASVYATDHSLFINISSLLRCVVEAGKAPDGGGLDKPLTKLEEVALTAKLQDVEFESKVSYELRTLLVRCTANLLYDNKPNKGYCLDTQLLPTLLDCTIMDARNPLMREWSILAIRNACINCPEAQQVIAGLTMQGTAPNDMLSELNLDLGALRITDNTHTQSNHNK